MEVGLGGSIPYLVNSVLSRVENLQIEHFNGGEHKPFLFKTEKEKARLYSIMWEYIGEPAPRGRNEGEF